MTASSAPADTPARPGPFLSPADQAALVVQWEAFAHRAVRTWAGRVRRSSDDYDDAVQAARMGLMWAARKFDPERGLAYYNLAWWYCRVAVQRWLEARRRLGFHAAPAVGFGVASLDVEAGIEDGTLKDFLEARPEPDPDARPDVEALLAMLKPSDRDVLVGYYLRGESTAELARRRGVSASRVYDIRLRAIAKLRESATA